MTISGAAFTVVADLVRRCSAIELPAGKEYLVESRLLPLVRQVDLAGVDEDVDTPCARSRTAPSTIASWTPSPRTRPRGCVTSLPSRP